MNEKTRRRLERLEARLAWPEPIEFSFVRRIVAPDGRYTGGEMRRQGSGPWVESFNPALAGQPCPTVRRLKAN